MEVKWRHSLAAKLFALLSFGIALSVGAVTLHHYQKFRDHLERSMEDGSVQKARETANTVRAVLEYWLSVSSVVMHNLPLGDQARTETFLTSFLASNREYVAMNVLLAGGEALARTQGTDDPRFGAADVADLGERIKAFNKQWLSGVKAENGAVLVADLAPATELPLLAVATRFESEGHGSVWAVLSLWQTRLIAALPRGSKIESAILNQELSPVFLPRAGAGDAVVQLLKSAVSQTDAPFGFRRFAAASGTPMLGAFAEVEGFGMRVVTAQDARPAIQMIDRIVSRTFAWAWVLLVAMVPLSYFAVYGLTRRLRQVSEATTRIAAGDFASRIDATGKGEVPLLARAVNDMAGRIAGLLEQRVAAARQEQELETARAVQGSFTPPETFESSFLKIAGTSRPATECGGDWWWHFEAKDRTQYVVIADATGHGVGAALVTAMAYSGYSTLAELVDRNVIGGHSPVEFLKTFNRVLYRSGQGQTTMTCCVAIVDPVTGRMRFSNAGHTPPVLMRPGTAKGTTLTGAGDLLGLALDASFEEQEVQLEPGDKIVMYTDGLVECESPTGEAWGNRNFRKQLTTLMEADAPAVLGDVITAATTHFAGRPTADDVTLVVVQVDPKWVPRREGVAA